MTALLAALLTLPDRPLAAAGQTDGLNPPPPAEAAAAISPGAGQSGAGPFFIAEYQIKGAHRLTREEIEDTVYPFLGPGRTADDVEQARAALEKLYRNKGFQAAVIVPRQQMHDGVVLMQVQEDTVARLRVKGARWFSPALIKKQAPSLAAGRVVNFNDVRRDIIALNQLPDRQVTPELRAGPTPGTVDIDLNVKDSPPLHGSVELNNRYSADTTPLRLNASVSDGNLWQLGHTVGLSFQVAPERAADARVFSGYYLARLPDSPLSLMLQGTKQDSDVSTLGDATVAGRGETLGLRAILTLPPAKDFYESLSLGFDYKHFDQKITAGGGDTVTPITYLPLSADYSATWTAPGCVTVLNAGVTLHLRGMGSSESAFDAKRSQADGGFIYFKGDLTQTRDLPAGFQIFGKVQGQIANEPLLDSEQFSGGGLDTVRGYLESAAVGDNALFGSVELRSPSLTKWTGPQSGEWRIYLFTEGGKLTLNDPLPDQHSHFYLASYGAGTRLRLWDHFTGSLDAGVPLYRQAPTQAHDLHLTFRLGADY